MNTPTISVIIPTHRRAPLLRRALHSINSQAHRALIEVIVISDIDDQSTESVCAELLGSADIYIRRNGPPGPSASRNIGMKLASGRFIMFLDDDDAWHPSFCRDLLPRLKNREGSIAYFNSVVIKESRPASGAVKIGEMELDLNGLLTEDVFVKNQIHMSCYLFEHHILNGLEFDSSMKAYEDWDFILAVLERQMAQHIPIICSLVHEVDDSTTDRRGASTAAKNFNAVLDYLYVYRRHAAPSQLVRQKRKALLDSVGLALPIEAL